MHQPRLSLLACLAAASVLFSACGGGNDEPSLPQQPGPGHSGPPPVLIKPPMTGPLLPAPRPNPPSTGPQQPGGGLQLPEGVTLRGQPISSERDYNDLSTHTLVPLSITFANDSHETRQVTIPSCFVFLSSQQSYQDGLNLQTRVVTLAPRSTQTVLLGTYCLNLYRYAPPPGIPYSPDRVTQGAELLRVCQAVNNRRTPLDAAQMIRVQQILWNITDRNGMTEDDKAWLNAL